MSVFVLKIKKHFEEKAKGKTDAKRAKNVFDKFDKEFIEKYFQFYFIEKELDIEDNPIIELSKILDTIELQSSFVAKENINLISEFLYFVNGSFLFDDAFHKGCKDKKRRFKSIPEIAATDLITDEFQKQIQNKLDDDAGFYEELRKMDDFKTSHKYIAIVQADGDGIGETIKQLYKTKKIPGLQSFSKDLLDFAKNAVKLINDFGGAPIYAGGDDLLFFAPVRTSKSITPKGKEKDVYSVFDLVDWIDDEFSTKFKESGATLSYGLSISYYKFPMAEALSQAMDLLFGNAKKYTFKGGEEKNAVAFRVLKHSGQFFDGIMRKNSDVYEGFKNLLSLNTDNLAFLNSVPHKVLANEVIINEVGNDPIKVKNFIDNNFDEGVHKTEPFVDFLNSLKTYIPKVYKEYKPLTEEEIKEEKQDDRIKTLHSTLRLVKFLNRKDNE